MNLRRAIQPRSTNEAFLVSLLVWNPLAAAVIAFFLGGLRHFGSRWVVSLTIAEVTALQIFAGILLVNLAERKLRANAPKRSWGVWFGIALLIMPFALVLGLAAGDWVAPIVGARTGPRDLGDYRFGIGFGVVFAAVFFLHRARNEARERLRDLEKKRLEAQLAALTAEMNPHLLFNALNTVAALVHEDPDRAEDVVLKLSEMYRGVLRSSGAAMHPLSEELRLCQAYLDIEHARFGERLSFRFDTDGVDPEKVMVPVLLFQPLVENAVKHGLSERSTPGRVTVSVRGDDAVVRVTIEDDGVGLGNSSASGHGKGMTNCKERLALTWGERASLATSTPPEGGTRIVVTFPKESRANPAR